jgi:Outer membrane protein beta-barrel domain
MKKLLCSSLLLLTCSITGFTQKTRLGFTAGATLANYKVEVDGDSETADSKVGVTFGVLANIPLSKNFSFQPAINFVQKGTKEEEGSGSETEKVTLTTSTIEIPLNFIYNSSGSHGQFFFGAGPSLCYSVGGKLKYEYGGESESEDIEFGNDENEDLMRVFDLGANILTGYTFANGLLVSLNYNLGLTNLFPGGTDDGTLKSRYFGLRLGYLLKSKTKK